MGIEQDIEDYIDEHWQQLQEEFLKNNEDMWSSEEQGMKLLEGPLFQDYCESRMISDSERK